MCIRDSLHFTCSPERDGYSQGKVVDPIAGLKRRIAAEVGVKPAEAPKAPVEAPEAAEAPVAPAPVPVAKKPATAPKKAVKPTETAAE